MQREIEESAHSYHERYRSGQDIVVGVNKYVTEEIDDVDILRVDPEAERRQLARLSAFKESRFQPSVDQSLVALRDVARGQGNLLHPIRAALAASASIGEVCGAMRDVFGEYKGGRSSDPLNGLAQGGGCGRNQAAAVEAATMIEVSRTLVKSEPELAELIAMGEQLDQLEVRMAGKGFGTRVQIRAAEDLGLSEADLERLLDQLAQPHKQPFGSA